MQLRSRGATVRLLVGLHPSSTLMTDQPVTTIRTLMRAMLGGVVLYSLVIQISGCSSGSDVDAAARDRCEAKWGVGNCVERNAKWVPLASATSTTAVEPSGVSGVTLPDPCEARLRDARIGNSAQV